MKVITLIVAMAIAALALPGCSHMNATNPTTTEPMHDYKGEKG